MSEIRSAPDVWSHLENAEEKIERLTELLGRTMLMLPKDRCRGLMNEIVDEIGMKKLFWIITQLLAYPPIGILYLILIFMIWKAL